MPGEDVDVGAEGIGVGGLGVGCHR
jgi:hypothetical protein